MKMVNVDAVAHVAEYDDDVSVLDLDETANDTGSLNEQAPVVVVDAFEAHSPIHFLEFSKNGFA